MAKIPIYQQQITPTATPQPANMRGGQFVSGTGRGFEAIGAGLDKIAGAVERGEQVDYLLEKDRIETEGRIHFASMSSQFDSAQYDALTKAKEGAAPGAPDFHRTYMEQFDKSADETLKSAPSQYAKQLLQAHIARAREAYGKDAFTFQNIEYQRNLGQQFDEGVQKDAAMVYANPALFENLMGKWGYAADGFQGKPDVRAKLRDLAKNALTGSAMKGAIDKNPAAAAGLLEAWIKDPDSDVQIDGVKLPVGMLNMEQRNELLKYAQQKKREVETKDMASTFIDVAKTTVASVPMLSGDIIDLPSAKAAAVEAAKARGVDMNAEKQLALESYVERVAADRERDKKRARESFVAGVFEQLDKNGGDYQAVLRDNPWLATQPEAIQQRVNKYAGEVATGGTRETDWQAFNTLVADPATLKASNLDAMKDKFNSHEFAQLKKAQNELLTGETPEQNIQTTHQLVTQMLDEAGYKKNEKKQAKFYSLLQTAVDQEMAASGKKKLTQNRIQELAADLLVKDRIAGGGIFGTDASERGFDIKVPDGERVKIEKALSEMGLPVNEYNVLQAYRRKIKK